MKKNKNWYILLLLVTITISCNDFVDIDPPRNEIITETVYTDDASATSTIMGVYSEMGNSSGFISGGQESLAILCGLSADEFVDLTGVVRREEFFYNAVQIDNSANLSSIWGSVYSFIYYSNSILEGLKVSDNLTEETQNQLEGEAKFIRALCYFYLVNLYGDVPLITTTDFNVNRIISRNSVEEVYLNIIQDLQSAKELLVTDYTFFGGERVRPIQATATALLARVFLFKGDWVNAEAMATEVIDNGLYNLEPSLDKVFLANSKETIWQLQPVSQNNTLEASVYIPTSETSRPGFVSLTDVFLTTFETEDDRRSTWIGEVTTTAGETFYYPFKYKDNETNAPTTEYSMVLRLAELYLIRAEARARQSNRVGALEDINMIRNRAGLEDLEVNPQDDLYDAIMKERRLELFAEGAHRWLDLKRTNMADEVLTLIKLDWQPTDVFYPIPQKERDANPSLTQNDGY